MTDQLTIELHNRLSYNSETGDFTWLVSTGRVKPGTRAGVLSPNGYVRIQIDRVTYRASRLAWYFVYGTHPMGEVDHINGLRADNRICNLRDVPRHVNLQNQRKAQAHNKTSQYLGVSFHSRSGKWRASININGRTKEIGKFSTAEMARDAYIAAKRQFHEGCML